MEERFLDYPKGTDLEKEVIDATKQQQKYGPLSYSVTHTPVTKPGFPTETHIRWAESRLFNEASKGWLSRCPLTS